MPGGLSEAEGGEEVGGDEGFLDENGTSPDAAAQAAYDAGRIPEPTVDAFWDAVRGDVSAVTQWKEREKARVDAETAQAARWGAERFRKGLAALADRDAQGRLSIGGGYLDDWSVRAQDAFNRGLRTEAQIAERLGIPYGAWMTHHPLGGRGEDTITGVVGEDGRDIRASDLLDLSHEWHHVGRCFDEVLFLDPNDFPDVRTPADIDDKQTAALFFYYTRMREAPREVNRDSLTAEERDALTQRERPVWEAFARTVTPARDAFVRAIAAEAEPDTLRPLAEAYANAMRAHKRLADAAAKQFLASIGKPRAYRNERPHRAGSVRYSVVGTPVASTPITTKEATEILKAKEDVVFTNAAEHVSATIKNRQRNKLVSADARSKSRANGFSDTEHLNAATQAGELFETARLVEDRQGKLDNGSEDPNVRIQRYVAPVTIDRAGSPITATAYLTVKVSTSYRRPKNQSEQTPNRIYSLELLELRDPRLQGQGPASSDVQPNARESTDTVAYPGADVNPRRSIGGWLDQATEAHLAAEREGDVETAQRLVHEAAERAGYRYKAAHGTGQFGFTVFDPNKSDDKRSLFFAGDPPLAATYQWQATDISGRGSANTAFRDVASTIRPLELDLNAEYPNDAAFIHAVTEAVERAGGTVSVGHLEPGSGGTVEVAPHEHITLKPWPQDYILVTVPLSDGPKAFDVLTPDTMVREAKALNAAREEELRGYAARLKAEYEADPNGEYYGAFGRESKKDRWLQAEHTLQTFLKNPQPYLENERLTDAQSAAMSTIRMNWEFDRRNDSFGIYHVALRMDTPLVIDAQGGNWSAIDIKLPGSNRKHWKTRQLAEYAQTHGYDGVQINNVHDLGPNYIPGADRKPSSVYIVFDGKQVKSLDPFTYDDQGNLIPLSQRFDTAQPDIRRSVGGSARHAHRQRP